MGSKNKTTERRTGTVFDKNEVVTGTMHVYEIETKEATCCSKNKNLFLNQAAQDLLRISH